jgi:hypothetical protein
MINYPQIKAKRQLTSGRIKILKQGQQKATAKKGLPSSSEEGTVFSPSLLEKKPGVVRISHYQ